MLPVKLPDVDRIQPQSNKFVTDVANKVTGDSKLNDNPGLPTERSPYFMKLT